MNSLRRFFFRVTQANPERKANRSLLKRAKNGDAESYLVLAANYLDLSLCLLYTSPSPRDVEESRMPSSA